MSSSRCKTVQELAENGHLQEIPGDFIVPEEERCNLKDGSKLSATTEPAPELPLIDMDALAETEVAAGGDRHSGLVGQIRTACEEWGFFQVKNHGVPLSMMKQMQQVVHEFLELPLEEKEKSRFPSLEGHIQEGYTTRQATIEGATSMWSDRLLYRVLPVSTRNSDLWPKNPSRFREVVERYCEEQNKVTKKLLELISESLGLKSSYINESLGEDYDQLLVANYYPSCPQPELAMGLAKHSDPGALTLLLQDTNSGLQVLKDGKWITVKPIEGAFVVNLGDQIEVASNGKYKSIEHRAFVSSQPRLSIATFTNPAEERIVGPILELLAAEELPKYKQRSFGEFKALFMESYLGGMRRRTSGKMHMHAFMAQPTPEVTSS